ncbi:MAG: ATP-grasp domain-containing protein [Bacteroidales bacterium]|jgi:biotin carboxylase|nr:ATP-grasp domain-containing protein [Bacteroidales bacterium]
MKKLLLLGGLRYLIPVIKTAQELGHFVITCDYLPDNIAHKYSDEYHNVDITDKEAILKLAKKLNIDGIMSFAVDPGVLTASYVAEKLGLPGCPHNSVVILQNKALFRAFLTEHGFNAPKAKGFKSIAEALKEIDNFQFPVIVKPVDSAGSKGVTKLTDFAELPQAVAAALKNSLVKEFIIEEFITQLGFSSDTDCFSIDNDLQFISYSKQYFDTKAANPYTPAAYSWPATIEAEHQKHLSAELKRLVKLLNLGTSIYNIEVRVGTDNKPYIMEVSPRGGGNRLSEMLKYATGTDLIESAVKAALGEEINKLSTPIYNGHWAEIILHTNKSGYFKGLEIESKIKKENLIEMDLWVKPGDQVKSFNAANDAIGTLVLRFETQEQLNEMMLIIKNWVKVLVD